jgi:hypothetical protein
MNWYWLIYAFVMISKVQTVIIVFTVLFGIVFGVSTIMRMPHQWADWTHERVDYFKSILRWWWISSVMFVVLLFASIAVPTKKEIALILIGGAVGEFVENDENAQKLPHDLFLLLRKEILEEVSDLPTDVKERLGNELGVDLRSDMEKLGEKSKDELIEMIKKNEEEKQNQNTQ